MSKAMSPQSIDNTLDMIDYDLEQGNIGFIDAVELRGYYFMAKDLLPVRYQYDRIPIIKCATDYVLDIHQNWHLLSPEAQSAFSQAMARPNMSYYYDSPGGLFRIHYNTTGNDAVYNPSVDNNGDGVPDYVNAVGEAADFVWLEETTTNGSIALGYDPPASDGGAGGGNNLYDIYLKHYSGAYGVTFNDGNATSEYPGRNAQKSYIYLDPTYQGFGYSDRTKPMKVTMAHEYFHAIQFIYNSQSDRWFWESGATWMEDMIYDSINDYYFYLRDRFKKPYDPLKDTPLEYGTCIWIHFLQQYHNDKHIIKNIWTHMISQSNAYSAVDDILKAQYGSDIRTDFQTYTQWNYICGKHDDGQHYEEGYQWRTKMTNQEVWVARTFDANSYPVSDVQPNLSPEPMGSNYLRFYVDPARPGFKVWMDGADSLQWGASVIVAYNNNTYGEFKMGLNGSYYGSYEVSPLSNVSYVVLIPQNIKWGGSGSGAFNYGAEYLSSLAAPSGLSAQSTIFQSFAGAKLYVYLSWNSTSDGVAGFNVYRSTTSGTGYQKLNSSLYTSRNYTDKGLDPNTMYYYIVKAVDGAGQESPSSNEAHS